MKVLGVDPGVSGGLAIVEGGPGLIPRLVAVMDVPTVGAGPKERVDAIKVIAFIQEHAPDQAFVERAQAMPSKNGKPQGASSGFKYGRAVGYLEASVVGCQVPWQTVEAGSWKRHFGLSSIGANGERLETSQVKELSRQCALARWPGMRFRMERKMDHGRAEAALIAAFGLFLALGKLQGPQVLTAIKPARPKAVRPRPAAPDLLSPLSPDADDIPTMDVRPARAR